jgi:hypothetical protein
MSNSNGWVTLSMPKSTAAVPYSRDPVSRTKAMSHRAFSAKVPLAAPRVAADETVRRLRRAPGSSSGPPTPTGLVCVGLPAWLVDPEPVPRSSLQHAGRIVEAVVARLDGDGMT